ncbi:hypothetical protein EV359DRAFT_85790 [Lentinula novae-zelandiae]|nr:hypothetical protein EV359DRAFT_85790 [Lentinula novae-zelandiae]
MYPLSCTCPRLLSIRLAVLVLLAVNVVGSPIGSPVLALASPSVTLTSVHPLASNSPWNLHAVVTPAEIKDEIYFWIDGDNAELYIGSRRFGLSNEKKCLEPKEVGIPQTSTRKIGQIIYPSTDVKEQQVPFEFVGGHYFQNIIQRLLKVSELNSLEVKDENGGGDLESLFTKLLRDTRFLGTSKKDIGEVKSSSSLHVIEGHCTAVHGIHSASGTDALKYLD